MAAPPAQLTEAAERWGTPLYVTDLDAVANAYATYARAFPGALVAYAVKANPDPRLLARLAAAGAGAEVVTAMELALVSRAGIPGERIVMNGVGKRDEEIHLALAAGALVNAESLEELDALLRLAPDHADARIGLRLNPGLAAETHPHLATGALDSKFGIGLEDLPLALGAIHAAGLSLHALGAHIGSAIESVEPYGVLASRLADATQTADAFGLSPARVDLGGGFLRPDADALAAAVRPHFPDASRLVLEPGRSLVADAGWLLTRVVRVQPRPAAGLTYLVADAGMNDLIRPMLYGAVHPVSLLSAGEPPPEHPGTLHLAGPVCEAGDILAHDLAQWIPQADLARAGTGALLTVGQAGAYGAAMASVYNGRLRPAEAVLDRGELHLSRRRETLDDLLSRDA